MERFLIINADDFGMCRGANLAVMELLKSKDSALTSSTIMAPSHADKRMVKVPLGSRQHGAYLLPA